MPKNIWKSMTTKNKATKPDKATYERHSQVLRGLINYHKRMMLMSACYTGDTKTCEATMCKRAEANNGECPKTAAYNDLYLGALEESLRLIEERIAGFDSIS